MNKIINTFLLAGDKCMPEMYLRQLGFTCSACGPFTKNKEIMKKTKETGDSRYIYQNELDKACFQYDMAYGDYKNLNRRTDSLERFIRTLKNKIYKYMPSISKNVYIDKLDDKVNKYNDICHNTIEMKPVDVKSSTYINSSKEVNDKDPRF